MKTTRSAVPLGGLVAVVTGAGRGIGKAAALALARAGADLVLCARGNAVMETAREAERLGARVLARRCDVSDRPSVRRWLRTAVGRFKKIDLVVNNAGRLGPRTPLAAAAPDEVERTIAVNAMGVLHVSQAALQFSMLRRRSGVIVNVSSGAGRFGVPSAGAYCMSKFALEALTEVMAKELSDGGIAVCSLNPGIVRTRMRAAFAPQEDPGTIPSPESLSEVFVTLAGLRASGDCPRYAISNGRLTRVDR